MAATSRKFSIRSTGLLAVACSCLITAGASAQSPFQALRRVEPAGGKQPTTREEGLRFQRENTSWQKVFEWLSDRTGKPVLFAKDATADGLRLPPARFSWEKYTLPEVIDVLNDALLPQNHIMIRRQDAFVVYRAGQSIPTSEVPRIAIATLKNRGRSEIVKITVALNEADPEEVAPDINRQMGCFGEVFVVPNSNLLTLQGMAGMLRRVLDDLGPDLQAQPAEVLSLTVPLSRRCVH